MLPEAGMGPGGWSGCFVARSSSASLVARSRFATHPARVDSFASQRTATPQGSSPTAISPTTRLAWVSITETALERPLAT